MRAADDPPTRAAFAALLAAAFIPEIPERDAVLTAASDDVDLRTALFPWVDAVGLDSDQAKHHRRRAERLRRGAAPDAPDMAKEIETHLARAEAGDQQGWSGLNYVLIFDEHGREADAGELEPDLGKLAGWRRMSDEQRKRALAIAKGYLTDPGVDPEPERWFGEGIIFKPAFAGYRALYLVAAVDEAWLNLLKPNDWARWAPIIVGYPLSNYSENPLHGEILRQSVVAVPDEIAGWVVRQVDADNARSGDALRPRAPTARARAGDRRGARNQGSGPGAHRSSASRPRRVRPDP